MAASQHVVFRDKNGFVVVLTTAQHTLTIFGVTALVVMALLYRPDLAKALAQPEPRNQKRPLPSWRRPVGPDGNASLDTGPQTAQR
jgi:hypothetical protein